ncbi:MAG: hypothetical protein B7C24_09755 [Bacteroidetes bacterium 4572_77]|nr:MAG: hypothetical protein B7C24_09755 [Bacteroidetes bacterium 4572_77]
MFSKRKSLNSKILHYPQIQVASLSPEKPALPKNSSPELALNLIYRKAQEVRKRKTSTTPYINFL